MSHWTVWSHFVHHRTCNVTCYGNSGERGKLLNCIVGHLFWGSVHFRWHCPLVKLIILFPKYFLFLLPRSVINAFVFDIFDKWFIVKLQSKSVIIPENLPSLISCLISEILERNIVGNRSGWRLNPSAIAIRRYKSLVLHFVNLYCVAIL